MRKAPLAHSVSRASLALASLVLTSTALVSPALAEPPKKARVVDRVVAVVGPEVITLRMLDEALGPLRKSLAGRPEPPGLARQGLESLIDQLVLALAAQGLAISVTDDDIERAIDAVAAQNGLTREGLVKVLPEQGLTLESYKKMLRRELVGMKVVQLYAATKIKDRAKLSEAELTKRIEQERASYLTELKKRLIIEVRL